MTDLIFVDTETTGLNPNQHVVWELAVIQDDKELVFNIEPPTDHVDLVANPQALEINHFFERTSEASFEWDTNYSSPIVYRNNKWQQEDRLIHEHIANLFDSKVIVGSNPQFDISFLEKMFASWNVSFKPHYHPIDIQSVMLGHLGWSGSKPSTRELSAMCGVLPPENQHEALADARWVKQIWDIIKDDPTKPVNRNYNKDIDRKEEQ